MRRVLIIGSGGAGKSTVAKRLGESLRIEVLHLDKFYWRAGWVETPKEEWRAKVEELSRRESWIMDGNYSGTLDVRLAACDTVVFLDLPRTLCLRRILKRFLTYRMGGRPDMTEGCPEQLHPEFVRWVWDYPNKTRPGVLERLKACGEGKRIIRLRSQAEVEEFLAEHSRR